MQSSGCIILTSFINYFQVCIQEYSICLGVSHQVEGRDKNIFNCLDSGDIKTEVCRKAFLSEKILHGTPSGIDNSVSSYGGLLKFVSGSITSLPTNTALNVLLGHKKLHSYNLEFERFNLGATETQLALVYFSRFY